MPHQSSEAARDPDRDRSGGEPNSDPERYLKTHEAAALLGVTPNLLREWEQLYGFPTPRRTPGMHRLFAYREIAALRDGLRGSMSVSAAVARAQREIDDGG